MEKRQGEPRRIPVPMFKKPRTALLAHPNNTGSDNVSAPSGFSGGPGASTNQQWNNSGPKPNNHSWQNLQSNQLSGSSWQQNPQQLVPPNPQQRTMSGAAGQFQNNGGNNTTSHIQWGQQNQTSFNLQNTGGWDGGQMMGSHNTGTGSSWQQQQGGGGGGNNNYGHQAQYGTPAAPARGMGPGNSSSIWQNSGNNLLQNQNVSLNFAGDNNCPQQPPPQRQGQNQGSSFTQRGQNQQQIQNQRSCQNQPLPSRPSNQNNRQSLKQTTIDQTFGQRVNDGQSQWMMPLQDQTALSSFQQQTANTPSGFMSTQGLGFSSNQQQNKQPSASPRYGSTPGGGGDGNTKRIFQGQNSAAGPISHQPWGMAALPGDRHPLHDNNTSNTSFTGQTQSGQTSTPQILVRTSDNTLKLLAATVQGMQHWAKYKDKTALIFELIGRVDSAVVTDQSGNRQEFMIKDDKSNTVRCVYFEIDRAIPRLVRGQVYRCVGTYEMGSQRLRCVSVRPATDPERRLHRVMVASSDRAMRDWVATNHES